jgi:predicted ATPase
MKYLYSQLDKDNLKWFAKDTTVSSLFQIDLLKGYLRGLSDCRITFVYPITAIAGRNRSGKSTVLAMAACAFHNGQDGFKLPGRKVSYYTFSDFFIQSLEEVPPEGISIGYRILSDEWAKSKRLPKGVGVGLQFRRKKEQGKWNKYSKRIKRNVVFFGVERVVPPAEKSVSKSYRTRFSKQAPAGWEKKVSKAVGRILGTMYDDFKMLTYGKYHLPIVTANGVQYSGFNMGAGENALFEIFSTVYATPKGTLLVIDEIELGLHEDAQKNLISELKDVCRQRHIQVICTTHSPAILDAVPPEARCYIQNVSGKTTVVPEVSTAYAAGQLSGKRTNELDIYVEDDISAGLTESFMSGDLRKRTNIIPIGSPIPIIHQLAAKYKAPRDFECMALMDGDKATLIAVHKKHFLESLESCQDEEKAIEWLMQRLVFLPGATWPEQWLLRCLKSVDTGGLAALMGVKPEEFRTYLEEAMAAGEHNEIHLLSKRLCLDA